MKRRGVWWLLALVPVLAARAAGAAPPPYVLGVIPQAPPLAMHERWGPLVERLAARTGMPLQLKLYNDTAEFEEDLAAGGPDLAFAHPAQAASAHRWQGYVPLVRDRRGIAAVLYVRWDSSFQSPADLEGKHVAFVGARSYCSLLVEAMLGDEKARPRFERQYVGSSRNVLRAVILGKAAAGASLDHALESEPEEMRRLVRVILRSRATASHPISAHPRVAPDVRHRLAAALLDMARDEADRRLLARVQLPDPEPADYERDYRPLERIR